ncbi:MAG: methylmalonyl-CoA epimerase [Opitutaceae bacterium]|jgi:methylmalonyl-CoA/ethylmalonyl-CoA epimerase|nr:methylmalonyl-CoA epimerase [Opitutaceae bacterium]
MIKKIDHLGIAVPKLDEAIPFYRDVLGLKYHGQEEVADQKVRTAFFEVGEVHIELLEPTSPESPIAKFIEKNGGRGGIHHIAYDVADVPAKLAEYSAKGVALIDKAPRAGANNKLIAFLHPKNTGGVLTELCQPKP